MNRFDVLKILDVLLVDLMKNNNLWRTECTNLVRVNVEKICTFLKILFFTSENSEVCGVFYLKIFDIFFYVFGFS